MLTMMPWATRPLTLALMERVDVNRWADLVERHKPKFAGLPPAGLRTLLDARPPKEKFASLAAFTTGSAPLDPALADALEEAYGRPVLLTYGSTETGKVSRWPKDTTLELRRAKRGSSGKVIGGVEVRIVDPETFAHLAPDEIGLIEVKNPDARYQPAGGWMRTSDLGRVDEDGYIYVEGRADDVIIRGGFKVPLLELERVMAEHPAVARCAATGLPDPRLGQVPAALVVLKADAKARPSEAEFLAWLRDRVSPFKVPVRICFVDDIPLTAMLKTNRRSLRVFFADELPAKPLLAQTE
jgi:acyl-coenzyme A synthetase/AMP-(fatty) acid ligase